MAVLEVTESVCTEIVMLEYGGAELFCGYGYDQGTLEAMKLMFSFIATQAVCFLSSGRSSLPPSPRPGVSTLTSYGCVWSAPQLPSLSEAWTWSD